MKKIKIRKRRRTCGRNKENILNYIISNPGDNYNLLMRNNRLSNSTAAHFLMLLEKEGLIKSDRIGRYKRFYPAYGGISEEIIDLNVIEDIIIILITNHPGITQKDLIRITGINQQRLSYYLKNLVNARLILYVRESKRKRYYIVENDSNTSLFC